MFQDAGSREEKVSFAGCSLKNEHDFIKIQLDSYMHGRLPDWKSGTPWAASRKKEILASFSNNR
jgi:hypothetical protein